MSLMGLGISQAMGQYCHMCASHTCIHTINDLIRQYANQQQAIPIQVGSIGGGGGSSSSGHILISDGSTGISFSEPKPKLNKKLLLIGR